MMSSTLLAPAGRHVELRSMAAICVYMYISQYKIKGDHSILIEQRTYVGSLLNFATCTKVYIYIYIC